MRAWFAGVVLSVLGLGAFCATAQASSVADTGRRIEQARNANDSATLVRVRDTLAQATKRDAHAGKYAYYYLGYADYALGDFYMGSDTYKATAYLHDGEAALQQALQRDPDFAEALDLLASSYGEELALDPTRLPVGRRLRIKPCQRPIQRATAWRSAIGPWASPSR